MKASLKRGLSHDVVAASNSELLKRIFPEVPGIGVGATAEAIRWARLGMMLEWGHHVEDALQKSKQRGRPSKGPEKSRDAKRAYALWLVAQGLCEILGKPSGAHIEHKELVRLYQLLEGDAGVQKAHALFSCSEASYIPSITRGKAILEIDENWNSPFCEKIETDFLQMTAPD